MLTAKQRKALWRQKNANLADIAKEAGVSRNHVRLVLTGERRSPNVEKLVAEVIGVPQNEAFPPRLYRRARKEVA